MPLKFKSKMFKLFWCRPCADSCYENDDLLKSVRVRSEGVIDLSNFNDKKLSTGDLEGSDPVLECSPHRHVYPPQLHLSPSLSAVSTDTPLYSPMISPMYEDAEEIDITETKTKAQSELDSSMNTVAGSISTTSGHDHEMEFTLCDMVDQLCSLTSLPSCDIVSPDKSNSANAVHSITANAIEIEMEKMEDIDLNEYHNEGKIGNQQGSGVIAKVSKQLKVSYGYKEELVTVCCVNDAVSGMEEQIDCIPNEKRLAAGTQSIFWLLK